MAEYDGTNDDALTSFVVSDQCLIHPIEVEDWPPMKKVKKVENTKHNVEDDNNPNHLQLN